MFNIEFDFKEFNLNANFNKNEKNLFNFNNFIKILKIFFINYYYLLLNFNIFINIYYF